jgi:hypothetical protein
MDKLASQAMLHFLLHDEELHRGTKQMLCVGRFDAQAAAYLTQHAPRPVEMIGRLESLDGLSDTLVFVGQGAEAPAADAEAARRNVRLLLESDLVRRFGL